MGAVCHTLPGTWRQNFLEGRSPLATVGLCQTHGLETQGSGSAERSGAIAGGAARLAPHEDLAGAGHRQPGDGAPPQRRRSRPVGGPSAPGLSWWLEKPGSPAVCPGCPSAIQPSGDGGLGPLDGVLTFCIRGHSRTPVRREWTAGFVQGRALGLIVRKGPVAQPHPRPPRVGVLCSPACLRDSVTAQGLPASLLYPLQVGAWMCWGHLEKESLCVRWTWT